MWSFHTGPQTLQHLWYCSNQPHSVFTWISSWFHHLGPALRDPGETHTHQNASQIYMKVTHTYSQSLTVKSSKSWAYWVYRPASAVIINIQMCSQFVGLVKVMNKILCCLLIQQPHNSWCPRLKNGHPCYPPFLCHSLCRRSHYDQITTDQLFSHRPAPTLHHSPPHHSLLSPFWTCKASSMTYWSRCLWAGPGCGRSGTEWCRCGVASPRCLGSASSCYGR